MSRISSISWLFLTWLIWGPIVINSQPGTQFFMFGIDWKADNLDNTMFWWGILLIFLASFADLYKEKKKEDPYEEDQKRDLR